MNTEQINYYLGLNHKENILKARENLKPIIKQTSLIYSEYFSSEYGANIYIKPENLQKKPVLLN